QQLVMDPHAVERRHPVPSVARAQGAYALDRPCIGAGLRPGGAVGVGSDVTPEVVDDPAPAGVAHDLGHDVRLHVEVGVAIEHLAGAGEVGKGGHRAAHSGSLNTRAALSRRNFGHTSSLKATPSSSVKMRSSSNPHG